MNLKKKRAAMIDAMAEFYDDIGKVLTAAEYNSLSKKDRPVSAQGIRNLFSRYVRLRKSVLRKYPEFLEVAEVAEVAEVVEPPIPSAVEDMEAAALAAKES